MSLPHRLTADEIVARAYRQERRRVEDAMLAYYEGRTSMENDKRRRRRKEFLVIVAVVVVWALCVWGILR